MVSRKMGTILLVPILFASHITKTDDSNSISIPNWWNQADEILEALSNVGKGFEKSTQFYTEWTESLSPLSNQLDEREKEQENLYSCIRNKYNAKLSEIESLGGTIDEKVQTITELENEVAYLEREISKRNQTINSYQMVIAETTSAYELIIEGNEDKASELFSMIETLDSKYNDLTDERDYFRSILESLYNKINNHKDRITDNELTLGKEICDSNFNFRD